jgi:hypothetical protein
MRQFVCTKKGAAPCEQNNNKNKKKEIKLPQNKVV